LPYILGKLGCKDNVFIDKYFFWNEVGDWLMAVGDWLLVIGCWKLAIGDWLLAVGYWLLVIGS
jgi:hypothetical protein